MEFYKTQDSYNSCYTESYQFSDPSVSQYLFEQCRDGKGKSDRKKEKQELTEELSKRKKVEKV
ncbi:hypothetical protein V1478_015792 [Vespula squamosa]|uniref:Uncharacterized protein n=1 Tax=Vespula squamosa TaxID=30214 RepID=A0ABD2A2K1_VESSQ